MNLPEWMPPLPYRFDLVTRADKQVDVYDASDMRDYGLRCVEAYKASLKPVAWAVYWKQPEGVKFINNGLSYVTHQLPSDTHPDQIVVPLYQLDQP